ncbi:MAG: hypothetical protein R3C10_07025 [Pirellulales bacterium]
MNIHDFLKWFRKKEKDTKVNEDQPELRRELREVRLAFEVDEDFDKAIALAKPFLSSPDPELRLQAKKHIALSRFRKKEYREASQLFRELADGSSGAGDWFNVVTSTTLAGDIAAGEEAFKTTLECQEAAGYAQQPSVPFMRHWYACALRDQEEYGRALRQIEELRGMYEQLKITDDTFVYIRGVPFLSHTMDVAVDVFRGLGDSFDAVGWIERFATKLDDEGQQYLAELKSRIEDTGETAT